MQLISLILVLTGIHCIAIYLAPVVQKVDNTIHRINLYPLNSTIGFPNTYTLDSPIRLLNNQGLVDGTIQRLNNWAL